VLNHLPVSDGLQGGAVSLETLLEKPSGFLNQSGPEHPVHPLVDSADQVLSVALDPKSATGSERAAVFRPTGPLD
jgi:hypothetical protein